MRCCNLPKDSSSPREATRVQSWEPPRCPARLLAAPSGQVPGAGCLSAGARGGCGFSSLETLTSRSGTPGAPLCCAVYVPRPKYLQKMFLLTLDLSLNHAVIYVRFFAYLICACYKPTLRKLHFKKEILDELTHGFALLMMF